MRVINVVIGATKEVGLEVFVIIHSLALMTKSNVLRVVFQESLIHLFQETKEALLTLHAVINVVQRALLVEYKV